MKQYSFFRLFTLLTTLFLVTSGYGQKAGGNSVRLDKKTLDSYAENVATGTAFSAAAEKLRTISKRMSKDFSRSYTNAEDILISRGEDNFTYVSCKIDGIINRITYDKKGNWHSALRYFNEDQLPKDVRHQVKSNYYDFNIYGVVEVKFDGKLAHVISLESKTEWKKIKVVDGEMEEMESFSKQ